jgi:muconolactone delta-isomerase
MIEYLVTMTTHVPEGTPEEAVGDIRTREAAHSRELATQGHLLRLWRPPLQPGEWRSLGLFAADDDTHLEELLASMPLRVWRTDEVTPLAPHPNDPVRRTNKPSTRTSDAAGSEFLTTFTMAVPADTAHDIVEDTARREADRARELAEQDYLERLWALPGKDRTLGLWRASDSAGMNAILATLPLLAWMSVEITPLTPHPSDPALASG